MQILYHIELIPPQTCDDSSVFSNRIVGRVEIEEGRFTHMPGGLISVKVAIVPHRIELGIDVYRIKARFRQDSMTVR